MNKTPKPIGWATTISSLAVIPRETWNLIMTVEHSPLKHLDPRVGHMIFQCLAFMWSGIFAIAIGSVTVFGISAMAHVAIIAGIFVTLATWREAEENPTRLNRMFVKDNIINSRGVGGEHE